MKTGAEESKLNQALWYRHFGKPEQVLSLEAAPKPPLAAGAVRVKMRLAPVNASDLIPITGAYQHRIALPQIAGYEGTGVVTEAPPSHAFLLGKRVLALRGEGTWQRFTDVPADRVIRVPENIDDTLAARAYINPLAARLMLDHFSPAGKHLLLTAAGSDCALLAGQWALKAGALSVTGVHRSPVHAARLEACGITPVQQNDSAALHHYAARAALVYDATGGALAEEIRERMPTSGQFISYGLLSGQGFPLRQALPRVHWFHIRNYLPAMDAQAWQAIFARLWPALAQSITSSATCYAFDDWRAAITEWRSAGRTSKPLLRFA